jgi:hypothetical protein
MRSLLATCLAAPSFARQRQTLERVLASPLAHARFLNTLARLEYIGVRKMLKARHADQLDLAGLQHILEEAVHATRLKKFAVGLAPDANSVATFSAAHTLAGDAAERYFQAIDKQANNLLGGASEDTCYWLTSTAIEIRAKTFYPVYQELLQAHGHRVSVNSIIQDEDGHLESMAAKLPVRIQEWKAVLTQVMLVEESAFLAFMDAVNTALDQAA